MIYRMHHQIDSTYTKKKRTHKHIIIHLLIAILFDMFSRTTIITKKKIHTKLLISMCSRDFAIENLPNKRWYFIWWDIFLFSFSTIRSAFLSGLICKTKILCDVCALCACYHVNMCWFFLYKCVHIHDFYSHTNRNLSTIVTGFACLPYCADLYECDRNNSGKNWLHVCKRQAK